MSDNELPSPLDSSRTTIASAFAAHANVDAGWNNLRFDEGEEVSVEQYAARQRRRQEKVPRLNLGGQHGNNGGPTERHDVLGALGNYDLPDILPEEEPLPPQTVDRRVRKSHLSRVRSSNAMGSRAERNQELGQFADRKNRRKTRLQPKQGQPGDAVALDIDPELPVPRNRGLVKSNSTKSFIKRNTGMTGGTGGPQGPSGSGALAESSSKPGSTGSKQRHRQKRGGLSRAYSEELTQLGFAGMDALYWQTEENLKKEKTKPRKPGLARTTSAGQTSLARMASAEQTSLTRTVSSSQRSHKLRSGGTNSKLMEDKLITDPEPNPLWSAKTDLDSHKELLTHTGESATLQRADSTTPDNRMSPAMWRAESATPDNRMSPAMWRSESATPDNRMSPAMWRAQSATPENRMSPSMMRAESATPTTDHRLSGMRRADSANPEALSIPRPLSRKGSRPRTPLDIPVFPRQDSLARATSMEPGMVIEEEAQNSSLRLGGPSRQAKTPQPKMTRAVSLKDMALMEAETNSKMKSGMHSKTSLLPAASLPTHQFQNALNGLSRWPSLQKPPSSPSSSGGPGFLDAAGTADMLESPQPVSPPMGSPFASAKEYYGQVFKEGNSRRGPGLDSLSRVDTALQQLEQNSKKSLQKRYSGNAENGGVSSMERAKIIDIRDPDEEVPMQLRSGSYRGGISENNPPKHSGKPPQPPPRMPSKQREKESGEGQDKGPTGIGFWTLVLHYLSLIVAEFPLRSHRRWLRRMYEQNRLERPANSGEEALSDTETIASLVSPRPRKGHRKQYSSDEDFMKARYRRSRSFQGVHNLKRAGKQRRAGRGADDALVEVELGRMPKRSPRMGSFVFPSIGGDLDSAGTVNPRAPNPGHRPGLSMEFVGEFWTNLGPRLKKASMSGVGWLTGQRDLVNRAREMDIPENHTLRRAGKIRLRRRRSRLARAWDQLRHPISSLRRKHKKSRHKARLMEAINAYESKTYDNSWDQLKTAIFIWSQWVFEVLSPPRYQKKFLFFTILFPFFLSLIFFFMAGEYPLWLARIGGEVLTDYEYGPTEMANWLVDGDEWRVFKSDFLVRWGARFLPSIPGEERRWFTSTLIHESFSHLASNVVLFMVLSWGLEGKYGFWRTSLVCLLSGVAGNFVSAAGEDPCALVLGASGCVFGLAGFYIVDVLVDFKHVVFPFLRLFGVLVFLGATAVALATQKDTSHLSHVGGFLAGCGMSFVLIPRFIDERFEAALPWMLLLTVMLMFVTLPLVVYQHVFPGLVCQQV